MSGPHVKEGGMAQSVRRRLEEGPDGADAMRLVIIEPLMAPPHMNEAVCALNGGAVVVTLFVHGSERLLDDVEMASKKDLDAALGTPEWRTAANIPQELRLRYAVELYRNVLARRSGAWIRTYHVSAGDQVAEAVLSAPRRLAAVVKRSLWRPRGADASFVDDTGPGQTVDVLDVRDGRWLAPAARLAHKEFRGRTVSSEELEDYLVQSTAYPWSRELVGHLERNGKVSLPDGAAHAQDGPLRLRFSN
jgi:hypothetical protein